MHRKRTGSHAASLCYTRRVSVQVRVQFWVADSSTQGSVSLTWRFKPSDNKIFKHYFSQPLTALTQWNANSLWGTKHCGETADNWLHNYKMPKFNQNPTLAKLIIFKKTWCKYARHMFQGLFAIMWQLISGICAWNTKGALDHLSQRRTVPENDQQGELTWYRNISQSTQFRWKYHALIISSFICGITEGEKVKC